MCGEVFINVQVVYDQIFGWLRLLWLLQYQVLTVVHSSVADTIWGQNVVLAFWTLEHRGCCTAAMVVL